MSPTELQACARNNFVATYVGLAAAADHVQVDTFAPYILCRSHHDVPLANFALRFDGVRDEDWDALTHLGSKQVSFRAYTMDGDSPSDAAKCLIQRGFIRHGQLRVFARMDAPATEPCPDLFEASSERERRAIADFMVKVFFENRPRTFYEDIAGATAKTPFRLFGYRISGRLAASVMIAETATELGLYNLCVHPKFRMQGIGAKLLDSMSCLAAERNLPLILQCAPRLVDWYSAKKFEQIANVESFCLK